MPRCSIQKPVRVLLDSLSKPAVRWAEAQALIAIGTWWWRGCVSLSLTPAPPQPPERTHMSSSYPQGTLVDPHCLWGEVLCLSPAPPCVAHLRFSPAGPPLSAFLPRHLACAHVCPFLAVVRSLSLLPATCYGHRAVTCRLPSVFLTPCRLLWLWSLRHLNSSLPCVPSLRSGTGGGRWSFLVTVWKMLVFPLLRPFLRLLDSAW